MIFLPGHERNTSNSQLLPFEDQVRNLMATHGIPHGRQKNILVSREHPLAAIYRVCNFLHDIFCIAEDLPGGKTRREAHIDEQLLTEAQEEILAKWIKIQGQRGVPMTYASVAQAAAEILGKPVGESWPKRFQKRHPDLKMKKTIGLEKARTKALNQFAVDGFFDMLTNIIEEYKITPGNIYNMDEKGIQLGIGARITVMIDRDQKAVYSIEDGNRELITVIECICADGSILHPSVIFQGQRRNSEWGRNNPCNARSVLFQSKQQ